MRRPRQGHALRDVGAERARRWWLERRPIGSIQRAAEFIDDVGFALLFPKERIALPTLWDASCARPLRDVDGAWEWGPDAERLWGWKDELPRRRLAWYGRFLRGRPSFLSRHMLALLYPREGHPGDFEDAPLSRDASRIAALLLRSGPTPTAILRRAVGLDGKAGGAAFPRAMTELGRALVVTHFGVEELGAGWPSSVVELTARAFRVGGRADRAEAARGFLDTMVEARPYELGNAFGWGAAAAREALETLIERGEAVRDANGYRVVTSGRRPGPARARPARSSAPGAAAKAARPASRRARA